MKKVRASQFRRGFKTEAESISLELRSELGLRPYDPLDPFVLADHLEIPVVSLDDAHASGLSATSTACLGEPREGFDALTVCAGSARLVVYNHRQPPTRRANTISHELSHVILEHPIGAALDHLGCRHWDERSETEAAWLGGALLVPREGAVAWIGNGGTIEDGPPYFGVSTQLFRWRVHGTGVIQQLRRRQVGYLA